MSTDVLVATPQKRDLLLGQDTAVAERLSLVVEKATIYLNSIATTNEPPNESCTPSKAGEAT